MQQLVLQLGDALQSFCADMVPDPAANGSVGIVPEIKTVAAKDRFQKQLDFKSFQFLVVWPHVHDHRA